MSSTTKKTKISPESIEKLRETKTTADLYLEHDRYIASINSENDRKKQRFIKDIEFNADNYISEIEEKHEEEEIERIENIEFIYKRTKEKYATLRELNNMDYEEIKRLLFKIKQNEKSLWEKLFDFFFGVKESHVD